MQLFYRLANVSTLRRFIPLLGRFLLSLYINPSLAVFVAVFLVFFAGH